MARGQRTGAVSDINNFVDPNAGVTSVAPAPVQAPAPPPVPKKKVWTREDFDKATYGLERLYGNYVTYTNTAHAGFAAKGPKFQGDYDTLKQKASNNYTAYQVGLLNVDSEIRSIVDDLIKQRAAPISPLPTFGWSTTPKFRSGGGLRVMGSGAPDSRLVQMAVSPGEQIDVQTRKQRREEMGMLGGGNVNNNVTLNITTQDADSFRRSEKQIAQQARALLRRGA
jgi:hypothetical protein